MARNKVKYLSSAFVLLVMLYAFQNCSPIGKSAMGVGVQQSVGTPGRTLYAPNVSGGNDQAISQNSVALAATASDADGTITSVQWIQLAGPSSATLVGSATLNLTARNLINGTYVFRVSVTDNDNLSKTDDVSVVVSGVVIPVVATFTSLNTNIFVPKCVGCHGAIGAGGYSMNNYSGVTNAAFVTKTNAMVSKLYTDVSSGSMPKGAAMLPANEILAIRDWINAGALNN